ncbi:protein Dok-7 [Pteropus alecto]|uniref:protein Dok-7 n=1 Tax=Pteropus alecto TaxID=9402 RepID=UPI0007686050|nr:protein Dok-7 [Pteropus alecto]
MLAYKDKSERAKGLRERSSLMLEDICGLDLGLPYEGLAHTLAIVCLSQAVMLGFDSREAVCAWDTRIRYALGEVHRFHVTVAPGTKLESGPATLHLCNDVLVVARDIPPTVTGQWKLSDLRRYGAVPNGFIFEGGTRCGYWAGVFFLSSAEGEQISFLFDCIVRGLSPTKGPCGLRPVLPDPGPGGPAEERGAQEALEALQLEKRLSLLSHCGRPGSGGDDRSLSSSSSEASHSDVSASSRLTAWPEQSSSSASTSQEGPGERQPRPLGSPCIQVGRALEPALTRGTREESTMVAAVTAQPESVQTGRCVAVDGSRWHWGVDNGDGAPGPEGPSSEAPAYVNIPASPSSKKQLHYLGLELGEAGAGVRGAGTSRYAQIDLAATAAAHRAGAQHAQAREERLAELEPKKKGTLR